MTGITSITKGSVHLIIPPDAPPDEIWRYGLGFPFQVAPNLAGLFCNIRRDGTDSIDLEIGSDVVLFDDLSALSSDRALPISRYEIGKSHIVRKGLVLGGFVPLGAKLTDGSPHPHAGTGFGLAGSVHHGLDETGNYDYRQDANVLAERFQFGYDGKGFRILKKDYEHWENLLTDWDLVGNFVTNAIPDGLDLLYVMVAKVGTLRVSGVSRWQHGADGWRPVSFVPVTGDQAQWGEPSLIRDGDGSLLFSARSDCSILPGIAFDAAIWRSTDNGETWKQVIYRKDCRSRSPVSLNQAADGTPFLAANLHPA
ncbi:MAG: sialidase family protein [Candidatus Latescibacterota bacterium]